ncbi:MAG: DUF6910 family protein [Actinomycetes bacterium]
MTVELLTTQRLQFDDGSPVRAASAVAPVDGGWLVAQDDAVHAAWWAGDSIVPVRLLEAVDGREVFGESTGSKHSKPDLEAAAAVPEGVLLLGSGSLPTRTTGVLLDRDRRATSADLAPLYDRVAGRLGVARGVVNMEGACLAGGALRWFLRGGGSTPSASVSLVATDVVDAVTGAADAASVRVDDAVELALGEVDGARLAVTDAVALSDGRVLLSAAAEDTPNAVDDGPVVASALLLLDGDDVVARALLPVVGGQVVKVEGLAVVEERSSGVELLAVVDEDVEGAPSLALRVLLRRP